jgi:hypothetical protein
VRRGRVLLCGALFPLLAWTAHAQETTPAPHAAPGSTHLVRPGDTLWDLSRTYMNTPLRWPEIQRDNAVPSPLRLRPGDLLQMGAAATVLHASGEVTIERRGREPEPLAAGSALEPGDLLRTGRNGFVAVGFADGSKVVLPSSSMARLAAARGGLTRIELLNGRVESYVDKQKQRDFEIRTRTFALGVKGTHFRVRSDDERSTLEVLEGDVLVTEPGKNTNGIDVRAGEGVPLVAQGALSVRALLPAPRQRVADEQDMVVADAVQGAVAYRLQLARDPGFLQIAAEARAPQPRFALQSDLAPGFYHTRVSAFDAQQVEGRAGEGVAFMAPAQARESAVQALPDGRYEIRWTLRQGRRHTFELASTPDFAAPLVRESGSFPDGVTIGPLGGAARYHWRCREEDEGASPVHTTVRGGSFEAAPR